MSQMDRIRNSERGDFKRCQRTGQFLRGHAAYVKSGNEHHNWTGELATNSAIHQRLHMARGGANKHKCIDCQKQAKDWSQVHHTNGLDLEKHFVPRCRTCHAEYDGLGKVENFGFVHRGENHGMHKLTENDIRTIRKRIEAGEVQQLIANDYGVHQVTISRINLKKDWGWLV